MSSLDEEMLETIPSTHLEFRLTDVTALDADERNWEGIARLDGRGFLIATDKYPGTLLGFVPLPCE